MQKLLVDRFFVGEKRAGNFINAKTAKDAQRQPNLRFRGNARVTNGKQHLQLAVGYTFVG